jgi:hypothetical protein
MIVKKTEVNIVFWYIKEITSYLQHKKDKVGMT